MSKQIIHKRAWVKSSGQHRAVAYCSASATTGQPTTTDDRAKVTCPSCRSVMEGRG